MTNPSGVDPDAGLAHSATVNLTKGAANVRFFIRLIIQNTNSIAVSVNAYLVIDADNVIRDLPLSYNPESFYCLEFTGRSIGLSQGEHPLSLYIGTNATSGVTCPEVDSDWDIFYV